MGRAPCCDKANVKKGPWSPEEDAKLKSYIEQHGTGGNWIALPQKIGLKRCGKSCRLRWLNYLRPNIRHGGFSEEEDNIICSLYISIGSRWSVIAAQLPGRTDNDIKNYWNTRLKKKLLGKHRKEQHHPRSKLETKKGMAAAAAAAAAGAGNPMDVSHHHHHHHHNDNLNPYWPELPLPAVSVPYPNEELRINNDHSSIRRLLIKLGGKFSEDMNEQPLHQLPIDVSSVQQESSYDHDFLPSAPMNHHPRPEFDHEYNNMEAGGGLQMLQGQNGSFLAQLEEMVCSSSSSSNPGRLDGMEFLYHPQPQEMTHLKPGPTGGNNYYGQSLMISWGETSSVVYPDPDPVAPNYGGGGLHQQAQAGSLTQAHVFDDLRYPTPQ